MSQHKVKFTIVLLLAFALILTGCGNDDNTVTPTPAAEVITGEETLDAVITETQEALTLAQALACKACQFNEGGEDGDLTVCESMCTVESTDEVQGEN